MNLHLVCTNKHPLRLYSVSVPLRLCVFARNKNHTLIQQRRTDLLQQVGLNEISPESVVGRYSLEN
jgi:hypothetical protein